MERKKEEFSADHFFGWFWAFLVIHWVGGARMNSRSSDRIVQMLIPARVSY